MIRLPSATPLLRCEHQLHHLSVELVVAEKKLCLRHARTCLLEAAGLLEHAVPRRQLHQHSRVGDRVLDVLALKVATSRSLHRRSVQAQDADGFEVEDVKAMVTDGPLRVMGMDEARGDIDPRRSEETDDRLRPAEVAERCLLAVEEGIVLLPQADVVPSKGFRQVTSVDIFVEVATEDEFFSCRPPSPKCSEEVTVEDVPGVVSDASRSKVSSLLPPHAARP